MGRVEPRRETQPWPTRLRSTPQVAAILVHAPSLKWRAALSVAYGAGLRASDVCNLKVSDIDSKQMLIRVEQGKRYQDRFAKLSPGLLDLLRT